MQIGLHCSYNDIPNMSCEKILSKYPICTPLSLVVYVGKMLFRPSYILRRMQSAATALKSLQSPVLFLGALLSCKNEKLKMPNRVSKRWLEQGQLSD